MPTSVSPKARKGFDYSSLDTETSQFVQQQTGEIRVLMKRTAQGIVEIGCKLIEVKSRVGHGRFGGWLEAEFEWSDFTARQFINVAKLFKSENFSEFDIAPSALYELAAPSTPKAAREEALARAKAGESITFTAAKEIKQKYATPPTTSNQEAQLQPEPEPVSQLQPTPTSAPPSQMGSNLEIVAIHRQAQAPALEEATRFFVPQSAQPLSLPEPSEPVYTPEQLGVFWRLGGRHLLYCGDPNSPELLGQVTEEVRLLLAFPPTRIWQSRIAAEVRIIMADYLPQFYNLDQLNETIESAILLYSRLSDLVISCFLPSPEILSIINRLERRGLFAEPDPKRVNAVISDWKRAGLKVERMS